MFQLSHSRKCPLSIKHQPLQNSRWVRLLREKVMPHVVLDEEGYLHCFTEVKREGVVVGEDKDIIFRASPNFMGSPWYDWVDIDWGQDAGVVPAHLRLFFRVTAFLPGVDSIRLDHDVYLANRGVFLAVMESLEQSLTAVPRNKHVYGANFKAHQGSRLATSSTCG
jgi:hypothetical protein